MERKRGARGQERASGTLRGKNGEHVLNACEQRRLRPTHTHRHGRAAQRTHKQSACCVRECCLAYKSGRGGRSGSSREVKAQPRDLSTEQLTQRRTML